MARNPRPWWRKDRQSWFVTIDGTRHNLGADRDDAFRRFHQLMAQPRQRPCVSTDSVATIIDAFLDWTQRHRAKRTYEWYRDRCQWFLSRFPDLRVGDLRPFHIQQWVDEHPNWSDGHCRGCIVAVQRPLRWAEKMGYIERNPIAHVEKPQQGTRDIVISATTFQTLLEEAGDECFRDLLITAWETGARPQELLRVEARHVDLASSRWVFPQQEAKGKQRLRIVYLGDRSLSITKRRVERWPTGPIFRNSQGRPWTSYAVNCRFRRLQVRLGQSRMKELGVAASESPDRAKRREENESLARQHAPKYCLYHFRHSFATRLLETGIDALTVSILMGHSDTTMLGKVYQHLSHNPEHLRSQLARAAG